MDEENREKYRRLINNLWYIYGNYSNTIATTGNIRGELKNGIIVNDTVFEESTINKAINDLNTSRANLYNLINNMRYKG
jgi:hypothetical protein